MKANNISYLIFHVSLFFMVIVSTVIISGGYAESGDEKTVARVDGSAITADDLARYFEARPIAAKIEAGIKSAVESRLEEMITAEALYNEAVRLQMDRDPEIRQTLRQLLIQKLLDEQVIKPVWERDITQDELQKYYNDHIDEFIRPEQVRLADIYIMLPEDATAEMRDEKHRAAKEAFSEVQTREGRFVFGEALAKYSDQPADYALGDTGFFDREGSPIGLDKNVVKAAFQLSKNGEIYDKVIETASGFHVIMLTGKRSSVKRSLEEVTQQLERRIRGEEVTRKRDEYIQSLRGQAEVRVDEQVLEEIMEQFKKAEGKGASGGEGESKFPPSLPGE